MKLLTVTIEGFKLYRERRTFTFGQSNHILGGHEQGKTTLSEAIIWCLKGCDSKGFVKGIKKRMMNPSSKNMKVEIELEHSVAGHMERHVLSRVSTARSSSCCLDGTVVSQDIIDAWTGQTDLFLSIFSPGYFGGVSGVKSRDVLISLLPNLDAVDVLQSLEPHVQMALADYDLNQPHRELQQLKQSLIEWENHLHDMVVRRDSMILKLGFQSSAETRNAEDEQMKSIQAQIQVLELEDPPALPEQIVSWEQELIELGKEYREKMAVWKELYARVQDEMGKEFGKWSAQLTAMKNHCQEVLDLGRFIKNQVQQDRKAFEDHVADFQERNHQERELLRQELQRLELKRNLRIQGNHWEREIKRISKEMEDSTMERDRLQQDIAYIQAYMLQYAHLQISAVNQQLDLAEFCLTVRKGNDGDILLHHRLLFKENEYYLLSKSDQFRCAFELSKLAKFIHGISIPIFMDDGDWEAVDADIQYFVASHVPDAELDYQIYAA